MAIKAYRNKNDGNLAKNALAGIEMARRG